MMMGVVCAMPPILYFIQRQLQSYKQHFIKHSIHT